MLIDCFISTLDLTPNRIEWSRETIVAFLKEPSLRIVVIDAGSSQEQLEWFHQKGLTVVPQPYDGSVHRRFLLAEALAQSEFFIFADNDVVPITENWLSAGLEVMRTHPKFGWLCYRLENTDFSSDNGFEDSDVRTVRWGGGCAIIRRDARTHPFTVPFVFDPNNADDRSYCEAIRRSGWMVGQLLRQYVRHIGRSESSAWGRSDHFFQRS